MLEVAEQFIPSQMATFSTFSELKVLKNIQLGLHQYLAFNMEVIVEWLHHQRIKTSIFWIKWSNNLFLTGTLQLIWLWTIWSPLLVTVVAKTDNHCFVSIRLAAYSNLKHLLVIKSLLHPRRLSTIYWWQPLPKESLFANLQTIVKT